MFGNPNNYRDGYMPWYSQPQQQQPNVSVVYIQGGETTANNYLVAPGQSVILIDNDQGIIFIKSKDVSGNPIPTRKFLEEKPAPVQQTHADYITREEFEKRIQELTNAKQSAE